MVDGTGITIYTALLISIVLITIIIPLIIIVITGTAGITTRPCVTRQRV
jgi:hypothetical protein